MVRGVFASLSPWSHKSTQRAFDLWDLSRHIYRSTWSNAKHKWHTEWTPFFFIFGWTYIPRSCARTVNTVHMSFVPGRHRCMNSAFNRYSQICVCSANFGQLATLPFTDLNLELHLLLGRISRLCSDWKVTGLLAVIMRFLVRTPRLSHETLVLFAAALLGNATNKRFLHAI